MTKTILTSATAAALAFCAGWFVEWFNSPLGEPLCVARGSQVIGLIVREWSYWIGWGVIALVCLAVVAVPIWGIWLRRR